MNAVLLPDSEAEIESIVREAAATASPIAIHGGGTRDIGRPVQAARILSTAALTGITLYEPSELVIAARAGTPLAEVEAALAENRQRLAFEPLDYRGLLGTTGEPTIGGVAATNASGPRRVHSGAARDHMIGVRVTTGRGETIKSGGRVMKNVTGYDFVKLMAGSFGTLGILTELTFKLLPAAETETTLVFHGLSTERAVEAMTMAVGTPFEITGAAHIPGQPSRTCLRFEGFAASCGYREGRLRALLKPFGTPETLSAADSLALWRQVRDAEPLAPRDGDVVWRISVRPTEGAKIGARLAFGLDSRLLYDWAGGLVWATASPDGDGGAEIVRDIAAAAGGHATLVRATPGLRAAIDVFQPEVPPLAALSRKLRETFDPAGILNPGRMG